MGLVGGKPQSIMKHLHVCNEKHEEIVHGYLGCPLCDAYTKMEILQKDCDVLAERRNRVVDDLCLWQSSWMYKIHLFFKRERPKW